MTEEVVLNLDRASRVYRQGDETVRALNEVTLSFRRGEFVAVAGPSGSGKTTLLNLAAGLDTPTSGRVFLKGNDLSRMSLRQKAQLRLQEVGFIFQAYNLVPVLSAQENAEFVLLLRGMPREEREERVKRVLEQVGLTGMEDRRPAELSGGQQQRVAVARAIVAEPSLVLADEPTANLDSVTAFALLDLMEELNRENGTSFVFSTHDPRVMKRARRLIRLLDGEVESDESLGPAAFHP